MLLTWSLVRIATWLVINSLTWSSVSCSLPVKARFIFHHIFSAGFNSGEYGGIKSNAIFSGIINLWALWKAPLSRRTILNSSEDLSENSFKKIWKVSVLQCGISNSKWSPVIGEKAPNKYNDWKTCWNRQIGLMPLAVNPLPFLVNNPKRLSSWQ